MGSHDGGGLILSCTSPGVNFVLMWLQDYTRAPAELMGSAMRAEGRLGDSRRVQSKLERSAS
jgi:hypothetical protein